MARAWIRSWLGPTPVPARPWPDCDCVICRTHALEDAEDDRRDRLVAAQSFTGPAAKGGSYREQRREQALKAISRGSQGGDQ